MIFWPFKCKKKGQMGKRLVEVLGNINIVGEGYKRKFMQVEMLLLL